MIKNYTNEELFKLAVNGDKEAEIELFINMDKYCYFIAHKYNNIAEIEDLASIAKIGLIKAYNTFNLDKGIKFVSYADKIMRNEILMFDRKNKKHKENVSLNTLLNLDNDGNELTIEDVFPNPEMAVTQDEIIDIKQILKIFNENAKERDKIILRRCIIGIERQRNVAKELNVSQSYIARRMTGIKYTLKHIGNTGEFIKVSSFLKKEDLKNSQ